MTKITYKADRKDPADWDDLNNRLVTDNKVAIENYGEEGKKWFIVALHANGLNNITYSYVKKDVHNH